MSLNRGKLESVILNRDFANSFSVSGKLSLVCIDEFDLSDDFSEARGFHHELAMLIAGFVMKERVHPLDFRQRSGVEARPSSFVRETQHACVSISSVTIGESLERLEVRERQ